MLTLTVPESRWWDEEKEEFKFTKKKTIQLEHSLISLSKWEAKWKKAYLRDKGSLTAEETLDYIKQMTLTQSVDDSVYEAILSSPELMKQIQEYIDDPMTATVINRPMENPDRPSHKETITSELIYYWMISAKIPWEAQKWHLGRLLTLIEVVSVKNEQAMAKNPYKRSTSSQMRNRSSLNAKRRAARKSRG